MNSYYVDPRKLDEVGELIDPELARYRVEEELSFIAASRKIAAEVSLVDIQFDKCAGLWIAWSAPLSSSTCEPVPTSRPVFAAARTNLDAVKAVCLLTIQDCADLFFTDVELNRLVPPEWITRVQNARKAASDRYSLAWQASTQRREIPKPTKQTTVQKSQPAAKVCAGHLRRHEFARRNNDIRKTVRQHAGLSSFAREAAKARTQFAHINNGLLKTIREHAELSNFVREAAKARAQFAHIDNGVLKTIREHAELSNFVREAAKARTQFAHIDNGVLRVLRQHKEIADIARNAIWPLS